MTRFERDVIDRLGRIETRLEQVTGTLQGDGQPGLVREVGELEKRIQSLEEIQASEKRQVGRIAAIVTLILNSALSIGAWFK
ncbi:MAG: hypothetical protein BWY31_03327 [Lentisphaerae bacterium ADurb.Bin242]|nr:MAG: hypothetical protein BWY31_03327 [Lentisphaerae bacterium ADurb.Bin242]